MAYSETLRMEAALCIWEAMLENRPVYGTRPVDAEGKLLWPAMMEDQWDRRGSVEMRHTAIALAEKALEVFDLIGQHEDAEALDLIPYDWEFMPAFVALVDWTDCTADPVAIAASLKDSAKGVAA